MKKEIFTPADVLLPVGITLGSWSVIACDQFSSEPDYWERVRGSVGVAPSTLNMIIPEVYLNAIDIDLEVKKISASMEYYSEHNIFRKIENSFIYIVRTLPDGRERRGLIGAVDLDEYEFSGKSAAILASEGTVLDRLPARLMVRREVRYELPHIMAFIDDKEKTVIEPLSEKADNLPLLYDFDLMEGGGHIKGKCVKGEAADNVITAMRALHRKSDPLIVIGDGNHSLAAAKAYWDALKKGLTDAERKIHPAGKALLEINNVYEPAIDFEAIHRVVFNVDPGKLVDALTSAIPGGGDYKLRWVSSGQEGVIGVRADCIGDMLTALQTFLDEYIGKTGCEVDYVHGEDVVLRLACENRRLGLILPAMEKSELFRTVTTKGVFPKKSFSVGHARDKRYYLECREIRL